MKKVVGTYIRINREINRRKQMEYQGQEFMVVSRRGLIASKKASGREVDLEDIRLLTLDDEESS